MAKKAKQPEGFVAGWGFWSVAFVLLLGPCIYVAWQISYESVPRLAPVSIGFAMAMLSSGVVSWVVNSAFQLFNARRKKKQSMQKRKRK